MAKPKQILVVGNPSVPDSDASLQVDDPAQENELETELQLQQPDAQARVLVDCQFGKCNTVVTLTQAEIRFGTIAGLIDAKPGAIA